MRVLAAMSGGVDSAVAAARAVDAGHDVTGVHLALSKNPQSFRSGARGCCSREDAHDAPRAADLTTVVQPAVEKGRAAGRAVLALLAGEAATGTVFTSVFRPGSTTAPPRA